MLILDKALTSANLLIPEGGRLIGVWLQLKIGQIEQYY